MKTVIFLLVMLMTLSVSGQNYQSGNIKTESEKVYTLSKKQNEDLKKAAIAKVKRFQENCKLIGSKEIPYSDKTCTGGYIDVAMQDFLEGAQIEITNFDGTVQKLRTVRRYLQNLAVLGNHRINMVSIASFDFAVIQYADDGAEKLNWYIYDCNTQQVKHKNQYDTYNINPEKDLINVKLGDIRAINKKDRP